MNYFAALLLAAGLPTSLNVAPNVGALSINSPAPVATTTAVAREPFRGIATVAQAYQTLDVTRQSTAPRSNISSTTVSPSNDGASPAASNLTTNQAGAYRMIQLINEARKQQGLAPYTVNNQLMQLAQKRAITLAAGPFTSDMTPYGWPAQMEQAAGIQAQGLGAENIAEAGSIRQAFAMLMASAPHRANILNPYETQIGVGVAPLGTGVAISELFIGPQT
jgi:uncharacterized protein YkwD